jgi:tetratricopeptide (TPR) repeat protein
MSLLLDALKEAEARKRGPAAPPAVEPSFDTDGSLALAEDPAPQPEPARHSAPAALGAAPAAAAVQSPADALHAARAARTTTAAPSVQPATARPAASPAPAPAPARNGLRWLIGVAVLLVLLLGSLALYDAMSNRPAENLAAVTDAAPPPATPEVANSAADFALQPLLPSPAFRAPSAETRAPRATNAERSAQRSNGAATQSASAAPSATRSSPAPSDRLSISREDAPLAAAWAALQRGDTVQAETLYRRVLEAEPGQVDAELGLAVLAHARGADDVARAGYRRVLESVPEHARAWAGLAELAGDGELGQIESRLRQLLANRAEAPLHFALGNVLARQQRWSDAQLEYFAAASLEPRSPDYASNVAVALDRIGKPAAALPWYRRALELAAAGRAARFDAAAVRDRVTELEAAAP